MFEIVNSPHQIISLKTDLRVIVKESEAQAELLNEFCDTIFRPDILSLYYKFHLWWWVPSELLSVYVFFLYWLSNRVFQYLFV